jgi:hypothetical protein
MERRKDEGMLVALRVGALVGTLAVVALIMVAGLNWVLGRFMV